MHGSHEVVPRRARSVAITLVLSLLVLLSPAALAGTRGALKPGMPHGKAQWEVVHGARMHRGQLDAIAFAGAILLRWNGRTWRRVSLNGLPIGEGYLHGVTVRPDGQVWAIGARWSGPYGQHEPMALHLRDGTWHLMRMPDLDEDVDLMAVVSGPHATEWAVGRHGFSEGGRPFIMRSVGP